MLRKLVALSIFLVCAFLLLNAFAEEEAQKQPTAYVSFWFDTEDYILPASDDAAKRLADIFTEQGVRATFKIVGEKARVLRYRGRDDVILALSRHDIGYHAEYHSVHPTPAEYEQQLGWDEGVKAFMRREGHGLADLGRIFGVAASCYGQAGGSWVPQSYAALRNWGIPLYLDETSHVGINGKPFWYGGVLNALNLGGNVTRMGLGGEEDFENGCQRFEEIRERVLGEGGGLISIYYHPCEWVHKQFWDGVNFARGANPPREEWTLPPQKSPEETGRAFEFFAKYLEYVRTRPNVRIITGREIGALYPDRAYQWPFFLDDLYQVAQSIQREVTFVRLDDRTVSAAEALYLLAKAMVDFDDSPVREIPVPVTTNQVPPDDSKKTDDPGEYIEPPIRGYPRQFPGRVELKFLYGPSGTWSETISEGKFPWNRWVAACRDLLEEAEDLGRIPAVVWVAGKPVAPEDFAASLSALAQTFLGPFREVLWDGFRSSAAIVHPEAGLVTTEVTGVPPETVSLRKGNFTAHKYVADDRPGLWGWVIFPPNMRCPKMMALGKLQAWTIKPAVYIDEGKRVPRQAPRYLGSAE